jgi:ankyrin repeat protein
VLLEHGADVHADNDSALRWASGNGHTDIVKLLQEHSWRRDDTVVVNDGGEDVPIIITGLSRAALLMSWKMRHGF